MTEPELKQTQTCPDCKQDNIKNMGSHKRFCKAKKQDEINAVEVKEEAPQEKHTQINITDVQLYKHAEIYDVGQYAAWFITGSNRQYRIPDYIGVLHTSNGDHVPCVLITTVEGTLLPPFMIDGFAGMYPLNTEWEETEQIQEQNPDTTEPFPPYPEDEISSPEIIPQPQQQPQKKPTFLNKLLGKSAKKEESIMKQDTKDLIKGAINAAKT